MGKILWLFEYFNKFPPFSFFHNQQSVILWLLKVTSEVNSIFGCSWKQLHNFRNYKLICGKIKSNQIWHGNSFDVSPWSVCDAHLTLLKHNWYKLFLHSRDYFPPTWYMWCKMRCILCVFLLFEASEEIETGIRDFFIKLKVDVLYHFHILCRVLLVSRWTFSFWLN